MLLKFIIWLGLRNEKKFLRALAKLEYGVSAFCFKLSEQAEAENNFNLAAELFLHAKEEKKHGKMLASLADGSNHILPDAGGCGQWLELELISEGLLIKAIPGEGKDVFWNSTKFGGKVRGKIENFNGLSRRYLSLRILFNNQYASDYSWVDKLAFMSCLEQGTKAFYEYLSSQVRDTPLGAIAKQIAAEEAYHSEYLHAYVPEEQIKHWQRRIQIAKIGLIIDLINHLAR